MTPEQERFVKRVMATVEELALAFAGELDDKVDAAMSELTDRWTDGLCTIWPGADPEALEAGARCIAAEVWKRRRKLMVS